MENIITYQYIEHVLHVMELPERRAVLERRR
jgi:hypothetical protein